MPVTGSRSVATMSNTLRRETAAASWSVSTLHTNLRPSSLHLGHVHGVAPDQKLLLSRTDHEGGMTRRVAGAWDGGDPREAFALLEEAPAILVGRDLIAPGLEE